METKCSCGKPCLATYTVHTEMGPMDVTPELCAACQDAYDAHCDAEWERAEARFRRAANRWDALEADY
jgi:hypothetical protein